MSATRRAAEHAHAADRFAREILDILTVVAARSRRLMGRPFGGSQMQRRLIQVMQLMVMCSNGLVCWPGLLNTMLHQRIRMPARAISSQAS